MAQTFSLPVNTVIQYSLIYREASHVTLANFTRNFVYVALGGILNARDIRNGHSIRIQPQGRANFDVVPGLQISTLSIVGLADPFALPANPLGSSDTITLQESPAQKKALAAAQIEDSIVIGDMVIIAGGKITLSQTGIHIQADGTEYIDWLNPTNQRVVYLRAQEAANTYQFAVLLNPDAAAPDSQFLINCFSGANPNSLGVLDISNIAGTPYARLQARNSTAFVTRAQLVETIFSIYELPDQLTTRLAVGLTNPTSAIHVKNLNEYADNTAALAAGHTIGAFYRTGDLLKVVH